MTKIYLTCIALCLCAFTSLAQNKKGSSLFYITAAGDYQINGWDVDFTPPPDGVAIGDQPDQNGLLRNKSNMGARLGVEFIRRTKYRMILTAGFDFKVVPQKVSLVYNARDYGYPGSTYEYREDFSFTNFSIDYKMGIGYSLNLVPHKGALEMITGLVFDLPMNGSNNGDGELVYADNGSYKDLVLYTQAGWGNSKPYGNDAKDFIFNVYGHLQLAYRFLPGSLFRGRNFRIGLDLFGATAGNYRNTIETTYYTAGRASSAKQVYRDDQTSLGLFIGLEL